MRSGVGACWERANARVESAGVGTGVVVDRADRLLLACAHVVGERKWARVRFPSHDAVLTALRALAEDAAAPDGVRQAAQWALKRLGEQP